MPRSSTRPALIAIAVFVLIAAAIKLAGPSLYDWLLTLHGRPGAGH